MSSSDRTVASEENRDVDHGKEEQLDEHQGDQEDGGDLGQEENNEQGPPKPVGFWDKSLNQVRKEVITNWAKIVLILFAVIMGILSLHWAVLFNVEQNLEALKVAIVSFDGQFAPYAGTEPLVGDAVVRAARMQAEKPTGVLGYFVRSPADYNNDPFAVRQAVYDEHIWAAIIVNSIATTGRRDGR